MAVCAAYANAAPKPKITMNLGSRSLRCQFCDQLRRGNRQPTESRFDRAVPNSITVPFLSKPSEEKGSLQPNDKDLLVLKFSVEQLDRVKHRLAESRAF